MDDTHDDSYRERVLEDGSPDKDTPMTQRHKSIYLLPNAFTTAALFGAFFAIIQATKGEFGYAAIAIFCSMVLDGMDGRVARLTNTQSAFGEQYDSLADMVSFGVAPALIVFIWQLKDLGTGRLGTIVAFTYCVCAALRLARFNANIGVIDKKFFQGLPSPSAAALVAGFVWLVSEDHLTLPPNVLPYATLAITLFAGLSMITNLPYYSGKAMDIRHSVTFPKLILFVGVMLLVISKPSLMLFALFIAYALSGYVIGLLRYWRSAKAG
ncbi:MAG: CDP-diacylglycerol--serine O-phosphatidyltransferase [Formosimonas sp.]|jgi:CDP-diacylglycerol--serine O-phosphatidyltransferase